RQPAGRGGRRPHRRRRGDPGRVLRGLHRLRPEDRRPAGDHPRRPPVAPPRPLRTSGGGTSVSELEGCGAAWTEECRERGTSGRSVGGRRREEASGWLAVSRAWASWRGAVLPALRSAGSEGRAPGATREGGAGRRRGGSRG